MLLWGEDWLELIRRVSASKLRYQMNLEEMEIEGA